MQLSTIIKVIAHYNNVIYLIILCTQNHYYHTLERDRDPRGIEVNANIDSSPDNN